MVEVMASPRRQQAAAAAAAAEEDVLTVPLAREHSLHLHQADLAEMAGQGVPPSGALVVVAVARTLLAVMAAQTVLLVVLVAEGRRMPYQAYLWAMLGAAVVVAIRGAQGGRLRLAVAEVAQALIPRQPGPMPRQILVVAVVVAVVEKGQV
jgi:hypothetical protein